MTATPDDLLGQFWRSLAQARTGLLGVVNDDGRAQPMTAHFDGSDGPLWFYARADSRLVDQVGESGESAAIFHYTGEGHELYASLRGDIAAERDTAAARRFWSDEVARWFPKGPDDPDLRLLRFTPSEAHLWRPSEGPDAKRFGLGGKRPDDVRATVQL